MKPKIYLALTHDWELRGDGSGDIERIQFAPMRKLLDIYKKHGARTTFLPDVMQQIRFRQLEDRHPELASMTESWDEHVREAFRQRHDIQLHLHPQWLNGKYENRRWNLNGDWSILKYSREAVSAMLAETGDYLENLLRPIDSAYRCIAFRAGALAAAPSEHLFKSLADLGIQLDVSMAADLFVDNRQMQLDYRGCEEDFLPFYPVMEDARKVSDTREEVVCVPLNHFYGSRRAVTRQNISLVQKRIRSGVLTEYPPANQKAMSDESPGNSRLALTFEKLIKPALKRKYSISDTGRLNYSLMREMLASIRARARQSSLSHVPVVLTSHPKYIRDWAAIERFVGEVSKADDIQFVTLTEVADKIKSSEFRVRLRD